MKGSDFTEHVSNIFNKIVEIIEEHDIESLIDIDLNDSILTLINEHGTYVINKQNAVQEIWLSSPISGPFHFYYQDGIWQSRNGATLDKLLSDELQIKIDLR